MPESKPSSPDQGELRQIISQYVEPVSQRSLGSLQAIEALDVDESTVKLGLRFPYALGSQQAELAEGLHEHCAGSLAGRALEISLSVDIAAAPLSSEAQAIAGVKNIIAIASGKGGVGKSSTAVNLALALQQEGARVGILDADIYGPSQPLMLGVAEGSKPELVEEKYFRPIEAQGLQTMSIGYMTGEKTPMVWRGPMASGALMQMIRQTLWHDVDYLLVDMPPGTGDIQLTLAQQVPCTGSVVVTTPQNIALLDARKGVEMFNKVGIPCFGIVENMATHICSSCGQRDPIFGEQGGEAIAAEYRVPLLGSLPLDARLREGLDAGRPIVSADPDCEISADFRAIARKLSFRVFQASQHAVQKTPEIIISDD